MTSTAFNEQQVTQLLQPINPSRILEDGKGHSHVSQQDILAHLVRVFGFGNFDIEVMSAECVFEQSRLNNAGEPNGRFDVCYRAMVRLRVRNEHGHEVCHYENGSSATAENQKRGDAHDLAYKSAISLSVKRAAIALGDQFGLSLYNKGQRTALVRGTLVGLTVDEPTGDVQEGVEQQVALGHDEVDQDLAAAEPTAGHPRFADDAVVQTMRTHWNDPIELTHLRDRCAQAGTLQYLLPVNDGGARPIQAILEERIHDLQNLAEPADQPAPTPTTTTTTPEPTPEPDQPPARKATAKKAAAGPKVPPRPTAGPGRPDLVQYPDPAEGETPNPGLIDRSGREAGDAEVLFEDEAIWAADRLGVRFTDYVQPMLIGADDQAAKELGRCYSRAGAVRLLVNDRPRVVAAMRKEGMATAAKALADAGTQAPIDINALFAATEVGTVTAPAQ